MGVERRPELDKRAPPDPIGLDTAAGYRPSGCHFVCRQFQFQQLVYLAAQRRELRNWGNTFASLMLGQVVGGIRAIPAPEQHFHDSMFSVYAQDVVKMAKKLTLSLGLRYELPNYARSR
jgi:hypothetical protein